MPKIDIAKIPVDTVCMYPEPFWKPIVGRERKRLGNAVGLNQFGVNLTTNWLSPTALPRRLRSRPTIGFQNGSG